MNNKSYFNSLLFLSIFGILFSGLMYAESYALPVNHPYDSSQIIYCVDLDMLKSVKVNGVFNKQELIKDKAKNVTKNFSDKNNLYFTEANSSDNTVLLQF